MKRAVMGLLTLRFFRRRRDRAGGRIGECGAESGSRRTAPAGGRALVRRDARNHVAPLAVPARLPRRQTTHSRPVASAVASLRGILPAQLSLGAVELQPSILGESLDHVEQAI
jgi:hypothetical protein